MRRQGGSGRGRPVGPAAVLPGAELLSAAAPSPTASSTGTATATTTLHSTSDSTSTPTCGSDPVPWNESGIFAKKPEDFDDEENSRASTLDKVFEAAVDYKYQLLAGLAFSLLTGLLCFITVKRASDEYHEGTLGQKSMMASHTTAPLSAMATAVSSVGVTMLFLWQAEKIAVGRKGGPWVVGLLIFHTGLSFLTLYFLLTIKYTREMIYLSTARRGIIIRMPNKPNAFHKTGLGICMAILSTVVLAALV